MRDAPVTLVSGASRGIGLFLARHYAEAGHRVIGCSRSRPEAEPEGYEHVEVDVRDEASVQGLFDRLRASGGELHHVINNAGIGHMNHALLTPAKAVEDVMATNVVGTFLFCREAARLMQRRRFGRIVNFATVAVPLKLEGEAAYAASKAAVVMLTEVLARELAPLGITVNAVGPGPVDTDLIRGVPEQKLQALLQRQAIPQLTTHEDVANVIDFFLAERSGRVTGQTVYLGGP